MTKKIDELLSESVGLSEDSRTQIVGLWEEKLTEAREEVAGVLREEFARKFEHDKGVLVESMDRFLTDRVRVELEEFAEDKKTLVTERVAYKSKLVEHTGMLNRFITESVAKEMKEFYSEKKAMKENFKKLENFLLKQLAEEIREFRVDKNSNLHFIIGKTSFTADQLAENYTAAFEEVMRAKPNSSKGRFIRKATISTTMGPGIQVDPTISRDGGDNVQA